MNESASKKKKGGGPFEYNENQSEEREA